jgi:hypothetical protein
MKLKNIISILLLIGLFVAVGCDKPKDKKDKEYPISITPILVAKGHAGWSLWDVVPQQNLVIKTFTEWNNFLNNNICEELREYVISRDFVDTTINFSTHQVIAVIDKMHASPRWSIDITDVVEYADKLIVTYTHLDTNRSLLAVAHQPYHIVKIPKLNKDVIFSYDEEKKGGKGL